MLELKPAYQIAITLKKLAADANAPAAKTLLSIYSYTNNSSSANSHALYVSTFGQCRGRPRASPHRHQAICSREERRYRCAGWHRACPYIRQFQSLRNVNK